MKLSNNFFNPIQVLFFLISISCSTHFLCGINITLSDELTEEIDAIETNEKEEYELISDSEANRSSDSEESDAASFDLLPPVAGPETLLDMVENQGGQITGQVFDKESGETLSGVVIVIEDTDFATLTDSQGRFNYSGVDTGVYVLTFFKDGYLQAKVTDTVVSNEETAVLNFAMPRRPVELSDDVYELQDFVVTAKEANENFDNLLLEFSSLNVLDVMTTEDFAKFAAGDVAEAIKNVSGVTVKGGQFAIIRGLDDRYSTTLVNGLSVPSPDPDRSAVPLDLFPTSVIENIIVTKTYTSDKPSIAAAGVVDIKTKSIEDDLFSWSFGIKDNIDMDYLYLPTSRRKLDFNKYPIVGNHNWRDIGLTTPLPNVDYAPIRRKFEESYSYSIGLGKVFDVKSYKIGLLGKFSDSDSYSTKAGEMHKVSLFKQIGSNPEVYSDGTYDHVSSSFSNTENILLSGFLTNYNEDYNIKFVSLAYDEISLHGTYNSNGRFPGYDNLTARLTTLSDINSSFLSDIISDSGDMPEGFDWDALSESDIFQMTRLEYANTYEQERKFDFNNINLELLKSDDEDISYKLSLGFASSETSQADNESYTSNALMLPDGKYITGSSSDISQLEPTLSWRLTEETSDNALISFKDSTNLLGVKTNYMLGYNRDEVDRKTQQLFFLLKSSTLTGGPRAYKNSATDSYLEAVGNVSGRYNVAIEPATEVNNIRNVDAFYCNFDFHFDNNFKVLAGARLNQTLIESSNYENDFFNFEILRESSQSGAADPTSAIGNTIMLGLNDGNPLPKDYVGKIDDNHIAHNLGFIYQFSDDFNIGVYYAENKVMPSFKEFSFITTRDPVTLDYFSGNPALIPSEINSLDISFSKRFNDYSQLKINLFKKNIKDPIERVSTFGKVPTDLFFNNPNDASVEGIELEYNASLPWEFKYFGSLEMGLNFSVIESEVKRLDLITEQMTSRYSSIFPNYENKRRLYDQPEWTSSAFLSFMIMNNIDFTISINSESDSLLAATGFNNGVTNNYDTYNKSYESINLVVESEFNLLDIDFDIGLSVKNLTNSKRGIKYDERSNQGDKFSYEIGREIELSISALY